MPPSMKLLAPSEKSTDRVCARVQTHYVGYEQTVAHVGNQIVKAGFARLYEELSGVLAVRIRGFEVVQEGLKYAIFSRTWAIGSHALERRGGHAALERVIYRPSPIALAVFQQRQAVLRRVRAKHAKRFQYIAHYVVAQEYLIRA